MSLLDQAQHVCQLLDATNGVVPAEMFDENVAKCRQGFEDLEYALQAYGCIRLLIAPMVDRIEGPPRNLQRCQSDAWRYHNFKIQFQHGLYLEIGGPLGPCWDSSQSSGSRIPGPIFVITRSMWESHPESLLGHICLDSLLIFLDASLFSYTCSPGSFL